MGIFDGLNLTIVILSAQHVRGSFGQGQKIDDGLLDSVVASLENTMFIISTTAMSSDKVWRPFLLRIGFGIRDKPSLLPFFKYLPGNNGMNLEAFHIGER